MKVCRVCLSMCIKMYHMSEYKLSIMYERVTGVEINSEDKLPKMICWECVARLLSANNFVEKALKTQLILLKTIIGDNITISDIASIDRAQHQLESTLGTKHYEVNNSDLHIQRESDVTTEAHDASNVELLINKYKDSELKHAESITIKSEFLDITEEPEETDLQVPKPIIIIKENESDEEGTIDDVSNASEASEDENQAVHKDREVCEAIKQERSNGLTFDKELRVVLEDVILTLGKQNTQVSFGEVTNNDVSYIKAQSVKIKETDTQPTFNKGTLTKSNNRDSDGASTIEAAKFIYPGLENLHDFPKNINKKVCARISTVNGNIDTTNFDAKSSKNTFICDICNKSYQRKITLCKHIQRHLNLFKCSYCNYTGHAKSALKRHINSKHTKDTVYNCSYCNYKTFRKGNLSRHINAIHTKVNVIYCSYCNYKTYDKSALPGHINSKHTKNTVYNCSYCDYKTFRQLRLNSHINTIHTKIKVFYCSYCKYKTYDKSALPGHINSKHTKSTVYNCSYCSYETYNRSSFSYHMNSKHTKN